MNIKIEDPFQKLANLTALRLGSTQIIRMRFEYLISEFLISLYFNPMLVIIYYYVTRLSFT